jgi:hypothetical protein
VTHLVRRTHFVFVRIESRGFSFGRLLLRGILDKLSLLRKEVSALIACEKAASKWSEREEKGAKGNIFRVKQRKDSLNCLADYLANGFTHDGWFPTREKLLFQEGWTARPTATRLLETRRGRFVGRDRSLLYYRACTSLCSH